MAELITTEEEENENSFLDWDDESLGRFTKYIGLVLKELDDEEGLKTVTFASIAAMMIGTVVETNAAKMIIDVEGHSHIGVETGDWRIEISKVKNEE